MAKKKKGTGDVDNELDFGDLEDLDSGFEVDDLGGLDDDRNPTKTEIARDLTKEASKGFIDSLIKKTASKSLPDEYTYNLGEAMDYATTGKEILGESKNRIEKSMFKLGAEVQKILPFQSKLLNNFIEKYKSDNIKAREESEEAMREAGIQSNLSSIFDKQLEVQTALQARQNAKDEVRDKQTLVTTKLTNNLLTNIDNSLAEKKAFTFQITKEFYRKSLELQYKSYFIQADMLKTVKDYYKGFSVQFDSIVKNTGLPEYVKLTNSERLGEMVRDKFSEGIYKRLFSNNSYIDRVKTRAKSYVSGKLEEKLSGIDNLADQLSMINSAGEMGGGAGKLLGGVFSGLGGSFLGEKLANKISPALKNRVKDNKYINAGGSMLSALASGPATFFADLRNKVAKKQEEYQGENTPGQWLGNKLLGGLNDFLSVTRPDAIDHKVEDDSILNHKQPAIYTNKTDRAITEVIPMYLAKILAKNTDLVSMYGKVNSKVIGSFKETEDLHYNYNERSLMSKGDLVSSIQSKVFNKKGSKERIESISSTMLRMSKDNLSKDKKLNKKELSIVDNKKSNKLLASYIEAANSKNVTLDYKTLVEDALDDSKSLPVIKDILSKNPELKTLLESIKKGSSDSSIDYSERLLSDVNSTYPISAVKELFKGASRIAGSKSFNVLNDNIATIISKAFSKYQMNANTDVIPDSLINGKAFMYMSVKDYSDDVKRHLGIFTNDVKKIINSGATDKRAALIALLGLMNTSLREAYEIDPAAFQTLRDYSPVLGQKGKLTTENLIEGKLLRTEDTDDYLPLESLRSITRMTNTEANQGRQDILVNILDSKLGKSIVGFKKEISEAKNDPRKLLEITLSYSKKAGNAIRSKSKEYYDKSSKKLDEVQSTLKDLTDSTTKTAVIKFTGKMDEYAQSLDAVIETDKKVMEEKLNALNQVKETLSENTSEQMSLSSIDREIRITTAYYKDKIKVLEEIRNTIKSQHQRLEQLQTTMESKTATELLKEVRDIVGNNLDKLKGLMNKAKDVDAKMEESTV